MKRYQSDINIISYNNKDINRNDQEQDYTVKGFDDLVDEISKNEKTNSKHKPVIFVDSETSDEESDEDTDSGKTYWVEIKINNKMFISLF